MKRVEYELESYDENVSLDLALIRNNNFLDAIIGGKTFLSVRHMPVIAKVFLTVVENGVTTAIILDNQDSVDEYVNYESNVITLGYKENVEEDYILFRDASDVLEIYMATDPGKRDFLGHAVYKVSSNRFKNPFMLVVKRGDNLLVVNHFILDDGSTITKYDMSDGSMTITKGCDVIDLLDAMSLLAKGEV